jgi:hypothetical protein
MDIFHEPGEKSNTGSDGLRAIFDRYLHFCAFVIDNKVLEYRVTVLATLQMVVLFVVQFTFTMDECPDVAGLDVLETGC